MTTAQFAPARSAVATATLLLMLCHGMAAHAFEVDTGDADLKLRWDNTFKYTLAQRLKNPDQSVAASIPAAGRLGQPQRRLRRSQLQPGPDQQPDRPAVRAGPVVEEAVRFRLSGAAWYDEVYNQGHLDFPTADPYALLPNSRAALEGGANNRMSRSAKDLMGRQAEVSDAFVYGSTEFDNGMKLSGRLGRHSLLYGESLFLGANGIAAAQGPVDLIKAYSLPNAQFKEIGLPVNQLSGNLQVDSNLSLGAYYQFEWRPLRLPAAGSYFSPADFVGEGADLLLTPTGGAANRVSDLKGRDSGQFGARAMFKIPGVEADFGVYAAKYDDKTPIPVFNATDTAGAYGGGTYRLTYGRDVRVFGASFSTLVGETNVAGEISTRRNTPLHPLGDLVVNFNPAATNEGDTAYARGNTLHANLSAITVFPPPACGTVPA
jgi:hypothetical protein